MTQTLHSYRFAGFPSASRVCFFICLVATCLLLSPLPSSAQRTIAWGASPPAASLGNADWYLDTVARVAWHKLDEDWLVVASNVRAIRGCHDFIILGIRNHDLYDRATGQLLQQSGSGGCIDSIAWITSRPVTNYFYSDTGKVAFSDASGQGTGVGPRGDTIQGVYAFYATPQAHWYKLNIHDYNLGHGMLGVNGKWIIPPIYERNFKFVNGIAEVYFKDKQRKINEKGEFVE